MGLNKKQSGAASLFVVIFTALIVVLITVSFVRIMLAGQQQATASDLSRSAFDSAQAGVEDAKRAILRYQSICNETVVLAECQAAYDEVTKDVCNYATKNLPDVKNSGSVDSTSGEIKVQASSSSTNQFDQAYTCVKILIDTIDFVGNLKQDENKIIPLIGVSAFDTIKIEWFNANDIEGDSTASINIPSSTTSLIAQNSWTTASAPNRPSIMRAQLVQYNSSGFVLSDLDSNTSDAVNSTMFLYPSNINGVPASGFPTTRRPVGSPIVPTQVLCNQLTTVLYSCSATIKLPIAVPKGARSAYLNLKSLYKGSHYRVLLANSSVACSSDDGSGCIKFHGVQPEVDSTGRANDYYRRVNSRVELNDITFPIPEAAVDLENNFCKNFMVTDLTTDYTNSCTP